MALVRRMRLRSQAPIVEPRMANNSKVGLQYSRNQDGIPTFNLSSFFRLIIRMPLECPMSFSAVDNPIIFNPCGHGLCHDCFNQENANDIKSPHYRAHIDTEKKRSLVEAAFDENAASDVSRLGMQQLGYLFGVDMST